MNAQGLQASSEEVTRYNYERTLEHAGYIARFRYILDMCADDRTFWKGFEFAKEEPRNLQSEIWNFKYSELVTLCRKKINVRTCQAKRQAGFPDTVMEALLVDNFHQGLVDLQRSLHEATIATELRRGEFQKDEAEIGARVSRALQESNTANIMNPGLVSNHNAVQYTQTTDFVGRPIQEVESEEASVGNSEPGTHSRVKKESRSAPW